MFSFQQGKVEVQIPATGEKFLLSRWQYELLSRLGGQKTFEEASREVYRLNEGCFTAIGLLNFYNWLYNEDIVTCECDSIFELVSENEAEETMKNDFSQLAEERSVQPVPPVKKFLSQERRRQLYRMTAAFVVCAALVRLVYVVSPLAGPPIEKLYVEMGHVLPDRPADNVDRSKEMPVMETAMQERQLAGSVQPPVSELPVTEPPPAPVSEIPDVPEMTEVQTVEGELDPPLSVTPEPASPARSKEQIRKEIEELRQELAGCQIRRDEFYLQSNEEGYRREVEKMTLLVKKIGEIEAAL